MEPLQTWWTTELYPTSDEDNFGVVGNFEVVKAADAQATIAALEQRVKELKQWVQDQSTANLETMRHMDEMQSRAMDAESQLTQRTAELEALRPLYDDMWKQFAESQAELERVRADNKALDKWRADVTVALQRPGGAFFVDVPQHIKDLVAELERVSLLHSHNERRFEEVDKKYKELRALILALPKVEGEIVAALVYGSWWRKGGNEQQFDAALSALLQHRQGMEG